MVSILSLCLGSPVREYKRGGLVPRPYKPLTDHYISKPTLSLTGESTWT